MNFGKNYLAFSLLGALLTFTTASRTALANDWPHWRGPDGNGISTETGWNAKWPAEGPKQLWKVKVGTGFSSIAVSKGLLYTMGHDGNRTETIHCLDAVTGKTVWTKAYTTMLDPNMYEGGPNATPTVDGDRVYTLSKRGEIFCLDAKKGDVIWTKDLKKDWSDDSPMWGFSSSAIIDGELLILNAGQGGIALKKATGELAWKSEGKKTAYSSPVPATLKGERAVLMMAPKSVVAVKVSDGKLLWEYPWKTDYDINAADPIYRDGQVFISSGYNHGCAVVDVAGEAPKLVWENKNLRNQFSSSIVWKGNIYGVDDGDSSHDFKCVSWNTGEVKWSKPFGRGAMIMADGKLIALNEHGELFIIEASEAGYKVLSQAQVLGGKCWTAPMLANGKIYCRNAGGDLVCLDVSGK